MTAWRRPAIHPVRALVSLLGLAVIGLAITHAIAPGGQNTAPAGGVSGKSVSSSGMAGMNMSSTIPPAPKNLSFTARCTMSICPIPTPDADTLAVAHRLGSAMAAAWITRVGSDAQTVQARVELIGTDLEPVVEPTTFASDPARRTCGPSCWLLTLPATWTELTVSAVQRGHRYATNIPLRWELGSSAAARRLVRDATSAMRGLPGLSLDELTAATGVGQPTTTQSIHFRLRAPDAMSATLADSSQRQVTIGINEWAYTSGVGWVHELYNDGSKGPFRTAGIFNWTDNTRSAQIVRETTSGSNPSTQVVLMNPKTPAWIQLTIDTKTDLVRQADLVTQGTFTTQRFGDFGVVPRIAAPSAK